MRLSKVSIIIPCYNQGEKLIETVNSILSQTFQDFEIIIVNDGSSDPLTNQILNDSKWPNTLIINIPNSGVSVARNTGIRLSKGTFILPLDGDDIIATTFLEKAVKVLEKDDSVKLVTCDVEFFGKHKGPFDLPDYSLERLMGQNLFVVTSMFRKKDFDLTNGYNENMRIGFEDWDFWLALLKSGGKVFKIEEVLFFYRISRRSRNSSISDDMFAELRRQIYQNHIELYQSRFLNPLYTFEYLNLVNSKEYKVGKKLIGPIRKLMNILNL